MDTPYGPCMIIVAEDNKGGIIGQIVFMPSKVYIDGRVKDYYRDMAPIIKNDLRGFDIKDCDHPTYAMLRFGIEQGKINGGKIIYSLPSIGWATTAKTFPKYSLIEASINMYNRLRIRLTDNISITNKQFDNSYLQAGDFNEEYDQLWEEAIRSLPIQCSVVKCAKRLKWKTSDIYCSQYVS